MHFDELGTGYNAPARLMSVGLINTLQYVCDCERYIRLPVANDDNVAGTHLTLGM